MCHFGLFCLQMTKPALSANFNYCVSVFICALQLADLMPLVMVLGNTGQHSEDTQCFLLRA